MHLLHSFPGRLLSPQLYRALSSCLQGASRPLRRGASPALMRDFSCAPFGEVPKLKAASLPALATFCPLRQPVLSRLPATLGKGLPDGMFRGASAQPHYFAAPHYRDDRVFLHVQYAILEDQAPEESYYGSAIPDATFKRVMSDEAVLVSFLNAFVPSLGNLTK